MSDHKDKIPVSLNEFYEDYESQNQPSTDI